MPADWAALVTKSIVPIAQKVEEPVRAGANRLAIGWIVGTRECDGFRVGLETLELIGRVESKSFLIVIRRGASGGAEPVLEFVELQRCDGADLRFGAVACGESHEI